MSKFRSIIITSLIIANSATVYAAVECDQNEADPVDPIMIDLGKNGFKLGELGEGIYYEVLGDGTLYKIQWVKKFSDEAFLINDINRNGSVDNGSELFGNGTKLILENNNLATNGFIGLAQYDHLLLGGNEDGYISSEDNIWTSLSLWLDSNADGISTSDEILSLSDFGIFELNVTPKENNRRDPAGNLIPLWTWINTNSGKLKMADVFFKQVG